jgi:ribonuclease Z
MTDNEEISKKSDPRVEAVFCGVGEAFDEDFTNTSILVKFCHKGDERLILLDCGFTAAPAFWKAAPRPLELDGIWISHLHGDHFLGLPQLLLRFSEHGREKKLHICGAPGLRDAVQESMELAYPSKINDLSFKVIFSEVLSSRDFEVSGIPARAVDIDHSVPSLGVRFDFEGKSLFYTGDGMVPDEALDTVQGCDLGIFETFTLNTKAPGHSNVIQSASFAGAAGINYLAAVHMQRNERRMNGHLVRDNLAQAGVSGFLPEPGDSIEL